MDLRPDFDVQALDEWIGDWLPGQGATLRATRMGQGAKLVGDGSSPR